MASLGKTKEWTRAIICKPKDNLTTEAGLRAQKMMMNKPCVEQEAEPASMALLIGMEYGRKWQSDRRESQKKNDVQKKGKFIKNDFEWWLKLRKTNKCFCTL